MGKKRKKSRVQIPLRRETLRGIFVLVLFALAGILLLSLFNLAGNFGEAVNQYAALAFGVTHLVVPVLLLLIAAIALYPDREILKPLKAAGILLLFLSFTALLNLLKFRSNTDQIADELLSRNGGYLGLLLYQILLEPLGFGGSLFIYLILVVVSVLIIFNLSLRTVVDAPATLLEPIRAWRERRMEEGEEDEDEDYEEDEEEEIDEDEIIDEMAEEDDFEDEAVEEEPEPQKKQPKAKSRKKEIEALEETALTTKKTKKVEIPFNLLDYRKNAPKSGDIEKNREIIQETLSEFNIEVEMAEAEVGPTVTRYALIPPRGVKLSRILSLQNDLALALAAHPIRIEAPIPGTSMVGIEVPNQSVAIVSLRELMESKTFLKTKHHLPAMLGKDVSGKLVMDGIEKMPHMLVAGATGSGKSVCLNVIILSLLYANGPDELKLIMVDPKRVELTAYEGIPHLLIPPITKVDDAVNALKWTIREMERRLDVLAKFGVKDIKSFNKKSEERMPYIVFIIDELADLMMTSGREVESSIVRIAQLARATGIHLILATQRPSVDVITGTIKANFPGRAAFAVASQTDSRTILDIAGAEKLLGRGDMLFTTAESSKPKRLQGAYVSEEEIDAVVSFLKRVGEPDYNYTITERERSNTILDGADEDEELLEDAIHAILQAGKASTSMLQRRLKVGYSRAARMMDILEDKGVIGPQDGSKPREVLIESWPPESADIADSIPTAADDYAEAMEDMEGEDWSEDEEAEEGDFEEVDGELEEGDYEDEDDEEGDHEDEDDDEEEDDEWLPYEGEKN